MFLQRRFFQDDDKMADRRRNTFFLGGDVCDFALFGIFERFCDFSKRNNSHSTRDI